MQMISKCGELPQSLLHIRPECTLNMQPCAQRLPPFTPCETMTFPKPLAILILSGQAFCSHARMQDNQLTCWRIFSCCRRSSFFSSFIRFLTCLLLCTNMLITYMPFSGVTSGSLAVSEQQRTQSPQGLVKERR